MHVSSTGPVPSASTATPWTSTASTSSSLCGALQGVLNTPVDSPRAPVLAVALGGGAGAGLSLLCNGSSRLLGDTVFSAVLGLIYHQFSRDRYLDDTAHQQRWRVLNEFPKMRAWLQHNNVRFSDRAEVKQLHACMQRLAQGMVDHYRAYCVQHGLFCDPQAIHAITRFCMAQCLDRGPFMALQPHQGHYYLAAIDEAPADALTRELKAGRPACLAFRQRGCIFMQGELASAPSPDRRPAQRVLPAAERDIRPPADCYRPTVESVVTIRHRRTSNLPLDGTPRRPGRWWEG